ncbi:MAG: damage repair protein [Acholeplasmataceae bacterium]|nr:damage repair protein [Acholeplasmataceae bacterium]
MEAYRLHRHILCIDLKSFYASVECAERNLDPFKTPLLVADESRGGGSIVLAVSPFLKSLGIPNRLRLFELPSVQNLIIAKPRMKLYLAYSAKIIEVYLRFIAEEDLYVYSVDEAFLDVTEYLNYYQTTPFKLAQKILDAIYQETKLYATIGIGPNMLLAKLALDIESKTAPEFIAEWNYHDVPNKLWPLTPLSKMWGIGHRMEKRLNRLGIQTIGDIAHYSPQELKRQFGILGEELYYHCHGIDMSLIQDKGKTRAKDKSYGVGQTLFHDYYAPDIFQIILEMVDDIAQRLRLSHQVARTVHLGVGYSKAFGGGFYRQTTLEQPTASETTLYETCLSLFHQFYEGDPIRRIQVSVSQLRKKQFQTYSLFDNPEQIMKEHALRQSLDEIQFKFGNLATYRASSELEASTAKARKKMVGGHHA